MTNKGRDLLVLGGGIIGCTVARAMAVEGWSVTLVEAGRVGQGASRAAAGMLAPLGEASEAGPFLELGLRSLTLFPALVSALREESGIDPAYLPCGKLEVAFTPTEEEMLLGRLAWLRSRDPGVEWLPGASVRREEPMLSPAIRGGLLLPGDHQVDNRLLTAAAVRSAEGTGVTLLQEAPADRLLRKGSRVRGIALRDGRVLEAPRVVLAAGAWSGTLQGLPRPLPVRPVRGQMASLGPVRPSPSRILASRGMYLVPRRDGRILVGATVEEAGFQATVTPDGVAGLLREAREAVPDLVGSPTLEVWAGLRPGTPDGLPVLGPDPEVEGLIHATGHYRNGILLAPVTALLVREILLGGNPSVELSPFSPLRFQGRH